MKDSGTIICDTPEKISVFRLLSIKGRLSLELSGMKFRGRSTFSIVKQEFGFKGNKQRVYDQYIQMLKDRGII